MMRKEILENLKLTGHNEEERDKGRWRVVCLTRLYEPTVELTVGKMVKTQILLRAIKG